MKPIKDIDSDNNNVSLPETIENILMKQKQIMKKEEIILKKKYGECLVKSMDLSYKILS